MSFKNQMAYNNYKSSGPPVQSLELGYKHQHTQILHKDDQQQHLSLPLLIHPQSEIPQLAQPLAKCAYVSVIKRAPKAEQLSPVVPITPICKVSTPMASTSHQVSNYVEQENTDLDLWIVSETPASNVRPDIRRARKREKNMKLSDHGDSLRENREKERTTHRDNMHPYHESIQNYEIKRHNILGSQLKKNRDFYFPQHNEQQHMVQQHFNHNNIIPGSVADSLNAGPSGISERQLEDNNNLENNDNTPPVMYQNNYDGAGESSYENINENTLQNNEILQFPASVNSVPKKKKYRKRTASKKFWCVKTLPEQDSHFPQHNEQQHYNYNDARRGSVGDSLNAGPSGISERQLEDNNNLENNDNTPPVMYQNNYDGTGESSYENINENTLQNNEILQFPASVNSVPQKRKYRKRTASKKFWCVKTLPEQDSHFPQHNEQQHYNYNDARRGSVGDSLNAGPSGISERQLEDNNNLENNDNTPPVMYQNNYDGTGESSYENINENTLQNNEILQFPASVNSVPQKRKYRKRTASKKFWCVKTLPEQDSHFPQHNEQQHYNYNDARRGSVGDSLNAGPSGISERQLEDNNNLENNDNTPPVMYQNNYDGTGESSYENINENTLQNNEILQFPASVNSVPQKRKYRKRTASKKFWCVKTLPEQDSHFPQHNEQQHYNYNDARRGSVGDSLNAGPSGISERQLEDNNNLENNNSDNTPPIMYQNNNGSAAELSHDENPFQNYEISQFPALENSAPKKRKYKTWTSSKKVCSVTTLPEKNEAMQNKEFPCKLCPKVFDSKRSLMIHMRCHKAQLPSA